MMKLQVLISTMNLKNEQENKELIKKMNIKIDSLTINQITQKQIKETNDLKTQNKIISAREKGLSKSRNRAIQNSNADICIIADDDVKYKDNFEDIVKREYEKNKDYDMICFFVECNGERKIKNMKTSRMCRIQAMRIRSFQITFKRSSILSKNMKFDETFGPGTYFNRGEDTIFVWKCIESGLKVKYVSTKIADVEHGKSTWFKGFDDDFFAKQGRVFYELSPKFYKLIIWQFAIRKYKLYRKRLNIFQLVKIMNSEIEKGASNEKN